MNPPDDIRDIKPLAPIADGWPWMWILCGVACAALLAIAYWWWRHRRTRTMTNPVRAIPAHERALDALRSLQRTRLDTSVAVHHYHVSLSQIIRLYVEERFGFNATDLTTEEILEHFLRAELATFSREHQNHLREFLLRTDRVKFAEYIPSLDEIQFIHQSAVDFVEQTRPTEVNSAATLD